MCTVLASNQEEPVSYQPDGRLKTLWRRRSVTLLAGCAGVCCVAFAVPSPAAALPDNRAYELVSPPDLGGASVVPLADSTDSGLSERWSVVATDGDSVLWRTITAPPSAPDSTGFVDAYRSARDDDGWKSTFVSPPSDTGGASTANPLFASPDTDRLLWQTFNATIDPSDDDPVAGAPSPSQFGDLYRFDAAGPFVRQNLGSITVPVAQENVSFFGASRDLDKVVFGDDRPLEPGVPPGGGVYQRDGETTRLVSKDEAGVPFPAAFTSLTVFRSSGNGSVVAFTTADKRVLYVWSEDVDATVKAAGPVLPSAPQGGDLQLDSISEDGRKVFFTTAESLSADDTDTSSDLYAYDTVGHDVTLLSAPSRGGLGGNSDGCAAPVPGNGRCDVAPVTEAEDGSRAYFVSPEQIVPGEGVDGGVNLYLTRDGEIRFIATLDPTDPVFGLGGIRDRHVRVTADGAKLLFESRAALANYNNNGRSEVYVYDSVSGALICASCRPNGSAPTGDSFLAFDSSLPQLVYGAAPSSPANADQHGGRIFFNSYDAIVPKDTNGRGDVYQYTVSSRTPALISSGTSENDSGYLGNGVDGRDVMFLTVDTLVPQDHNGNVYKLYDARVDGGFPIANPLPPCQGAACRPDEVAPLPAPQATGRIVPRVRRAQAKMAVPRLTVSASRSVKGSSLRLAAKVSGAGHLRVSGRGLVSSSRKTTRAASYHLTVRLSKASAAKLRRVHRLTLVATVRFAPSKGATRSVRARLTFAAPSNRNAR